MPQYCTDSSGENSLTSELCSRGRVQDVMQLFDPSSQCPLCRAFRTGFFKYIYHSRMCRSIVTVSTINSWTRMSSRSKFDATDRQYVFLPVQKSYGQRFGKRSWDDQLGMHRRLCTVTGAYSMEETSKHGVLSLRQFKLAQKTRIKVVSVHDRTPRHGVSKTLRRLHCFLDWCVADGNMAMKSLYEKVYSVHGSGLTSSIRCRRRGGLDAEGACSQVFCHPN